MSKRVINSGITYDEFNIVHAGIECVLCICYTPCHCVYCPTIH